MTTTLGDGLTSATYSSSVNFLLPQQPPQDLQPEIQSALSQVYLAMQQVIQCFINNCGISSQPSEQWPDLSGNVNTVLAGNMGRFYVIASEAIQLGAIVSLWNNSGTINVRNANSTDNTKPADGFCSTNGGIAAGTTGEIVLGTGIVNINGLTPGTRYWLSESNGQIQASSVGTGQYIGVALSTTALFVNIAPMG